MVFAGACSFGILSTFVKLAYREGYTAAEISVSQAFIGMLVLWLWVLTQRKLKKNTDRRPSQDSSWPVLLTGVAIGLTTFVYYLSVHYIPASVAIVVLMQFTWMGISLEWLLYKRRPGWIQLTAAAMVLGGTVMASDIWNVDNRGNFSMKGIFFALLSALLYAIYIVANGKTGKNISVLKKSALIMTGSTAGILIVNMPQFIVHYNIDINLFKWAVFLAVFGTIIPPVLFAKAIPKIGAGFSAIVMTAELPVAVLCSHMILNEPIAQQQWAGVVVMLLAMVFMNLYKKNRPEKT